ncbi:MAG: tetratricopeptide repeat protein [Verrucomicrobiae bacterium]|nr:tetratricopeptide repeat protein [Verrucomicrobiae bacterium]
MEQSILAGGKVSNKGGFVFLASTISECRYWIAVIAAVGMTACGDDGSGENVAEPNSIPDRQTSEASAPESPVFTRDVAPLIFNHCSPCHRPGESAPFDLLTYADVRKHSKLIAEVTRDRYMPPWLPAHGVNAFVGERWLSDVEITTIGRWVDQGTIEGDTADLQDPPKFVEGWQLREPDLIVTLPEPFMMPADSGDVYRNFVVPIPLDAARYVQALEFRPGDTRAVHHAFMLIDSSDASRKLDAADAAPGFGGMSTGTGARSPGGHFISWQPGKVASESPEGMAWRLAPGTDLVLQLHMQATGREEKVQPSVGIYFTSERPTLFPYKLVLRSTEIEIPAGDKDFSFETSYMLPVPVNVLAVIPHAHYLGKKLHAFATLPDGSKQWLMRIDDWDFNWQGDYRYEKPLRLPKGTTLVQQFSYDNSSENPRNPNDPPKVVRYGLNTTDEMGEFWIQVLPDNPEDTEILNRDYGRYAIVQRAKELRLQLKSEPRNAEIWKELAKSTMAIGTTDEARSQLQKALQLDGRLAEAHYLLGMTYAREQQMDKARSAFLNCLASEPDHAAANNGLGIIAQQSNMLPLARSFFQRAVDSDPENATTVINLARILGRLGEQDQAVLYYEKAIALQPQNASLPQELNALRARR